MEKKNIVSLQQAGNLLKGEISLRVKMTLMTLLLAVGMSGQPEYRPPVDFSILKGYRTDPTPNMYERSQDVFREDYFDLTKSEKIFVDQNRRKIGHIDFTSLEEINTRDSRTDIIHQFPELGIDPETITYLVADVDLFPGAEDQQDILIIAVPYRKRSFRLYAINTSIHVIEEMPKTIVSRYPNNSRYGKGFKQPVYNFVREATESCDKNIHRCISGSGKHRQEEPYIFGPESPISQYLQPYISGPDGYSFVHERLYKSVDVELHEQQIREELSFEFGCEPDEIIFRNDHLSFSDIVEYNLDKDIEVPINNYVVSKEQGKTYPADMYYRLCDLNLLEGDDWEEIATDTIPLREFLDEEIGKRDMPNILKQVLRRGLGAIESMFDHEAMSHAKATTMYQIVPSLMGEELRRRYGERYDPEDVVGTGKLVIDFFEDYFHIFRYGDTHENSKLDLGSFAHNFGEDEVAGLLGCIGSDFDLTEEDKDVLVVWYQKTGRVGGYPERVLGMVEWFHELINDPTLSAEGELTNGYKFVQHFKQDLGWIDSEGCPTEKPRDVNEFFFTLLMLRKSMRTNKTIVQRKERVDDRFEYDGGFGKETSTYAAKIRTMNLLH